MRQLLGLLTYSLFLFNTINSQAPKKASPSDIYHSIEELNFLGSALYIAAHPDDENTRLISYLANNTKARTAYLSLTRGDGGQNLIGPELRELLGVLRTQELLAARKVDGGEQFFTRANDFGYSKHPNETLEIWNKETILGDVVKVIRQFKPDVIINRFDHRSPGSTHGHHTSSAMLSYEAFDLANDPTAYPNQLSTSSTWQPKRLFFNTSWWFYGSQEKFEEADKSKLLSMDVGVYYPMLGMSNNEIASLASSQHLCQGFGRLTARGSESEYVELLKGDLPNDKNNLFDGIDTSWSRIKGGKAIGEILYEVQRNFNFINPSEHLPSLLKAYTLLQKTTDKHWKEIKTEELTNIISAISGLYLEASTETSYANPGETVSVQIQALNRSTINAKIKSVYINDQDLQLNAVALKNNEFFDKKIALHIPTTTEFTSPYWLIEKGTLGTYTVKNNNLIGKPESPSAFVATFNLDFNGVSIPIKKSVVYKFAKPEKGEIYQPFEILPEATASFADKVIIFADASEKRIPVIIKAHQDSISGSIELKYGEGWQVDKKEQAFFIAKKGDEKTVYFNLSPPSLENENSITPMIKLNGREITKELITIAYDHIPTQMVLLPSEAKVVRLNIEKAGDNIGYIMGAGDEVPTSLEQIGYNVQIIDPSTITEESLAKYDAVVLGIRAYNVVDELKFKQRFILDYAKNGGTVIVQYNTASRWGSQFENIAPFELEISRDRVTNENSEVEIIAKDNSLVNFPNKINANDFQGWVQERGLYFPDKWGSEFTPILSMHDKDEESTKGSLLIAPYGKGNYIYTGLSFFRELPVGVPGAYKLFSNMLSVGKDKVEIKEQIKG
ncbi:PIG-L family deacetylase [Maribacter hydrothermalis]|uniref:LmbE family protein n=1 Tax=Maribacter hydrothermalis TaxID=1836467 RepID=A0A1B7Z9A6_9FLAO|nr:PIG-L family deacetylase [Maribacter hydrothermalis]APQ18836.1 LmbE family protein [Maribacter hydrothermalis]OBR39150.1 LmbE family protein [Maribacter hydrothermalis]